MKDYIKLIRVKHYVKNLIIFCPLLFSGQLFNRDYFLTCLLGTFAFCMVSSIVYIVNDYKDVEKMVRGLIAIGLYECRKIGATVAVLYFMFMLLTSISVTAYSIMIGV